MPGFVSWDPGGLSPRGLLGVGGNFPQQPEGCSRKFPPKLWAGAPVHQDASQHPPALGGGILGPPLLHPEPLEHPRSLGISASPSVGGASFLGMDGERFLPCRK